MEGEEGHSDLFDFDVDFVVCCMYFLEVVVVVFRLLFLSWFKRERTDDVVGASCI